MFAEFRSSSLSRLAREIAVRLLSDNKNNPFTKHWIVIQNKEAQQWLTLRIAEENGIASNLKFVLPSELMWELYRSEHPGLPKILPSDRIPMCLQIFELLTDQPEVLKSTGFIFSDFDHETLFQLSAQIADVFDLYQVYRPEMLRNWEKGIHQTEDSHEIWQSEIWRMLRKSWDSRFPGLPDRVEANHQLKKKLKSGDFDFNSIPEKINVFGLSQFSAPFASLLEAISVEKEVEFYNLDLGSDFSNESVREWMMPVLQQKVQAEQLLKRLVTDSSGPDFQSANLKHERESAFTLFKNSESNVKIEIHSCHNPRREAEVLKEELLKLFDNDEKLNPGEVLIMVPDVEKYAPVIRSVFSYDEGEPVIPVGIPFFNAENGTRVITRLMELLGSDFKVNDFLDFLTLPGIQQKSGLTTGDIETISAWLADNNIHWGLGLESSAYSLEKSALNFLAGYAMESGEFESKEEYIPFDGVVTSDHAELSARYYRLIRFLQESYQETKANRKISDWIELVQNWSDELLPVESSGVKTTLQKLYQAAAYSENSPELSYDLFKSWLAEQLTDQQASSSGFGRGVVFSSYIPYRSIPFEVVAMLGFNEQTFPRKPVRPSFDLIQNYPEAGDRITQKDDELLFLEVLAGTEKHLHISYEGQDQYSDTEKLPSILVQKMEDALRASGVSYVHKKQKLHAFDREYFDEQMNYSEKNKTLAFLTITKQKETTPFISESFPDSIAFRENRIALQDVINFFTHPSKYIIQKGLGISTLFEQRDPEDRELFDISGLANYKLQQLLYHGLSGHYPFDKLKYYAKNTGLIPQNLPGENGFTATYNEVSALVAAEQRFSSEKKNSIEILGHLGGLTIAGRLAEIAGNKRIKVRVGRRRANELIELWINHLVLQIFHPEISSSHLISKEAKYGKSFILHSYFGFVDHAEQELEKLLQWFIRAHQNKSGLAFFPETSQVYSEHISKGDAPSLALTKAESEWSGNDFSYNPEGTDYYNQLIWRAQNPINTEDFSVNALTFWEPLRANLEEES